MTAVPTGQAGDLTGAILSRKYSLKRLLGTGGMGSVYESQAPDGARVAIKVLSADFLGDLDILTRFLEEGKTCQRLVHPNIVRVFEVAQAEDATPYIVMEMLDGVPLSAYTRSGVRVPMMQAGNIFQNILAGLGAAHAQGIVHRDLKPENVFLARDPSGQFIAKILDFGIAKVMDVAGGMGNKTRTGVLLGTPAYMSPEQIKNSKDVDARADLWSAGVMFYEMLAGRVAFPAPTEYARLAAVLNTTPSPLETIDPQLTRLSAFVSLSMQKDRAQRFQSALEMARALTGAMGADGGPLPLSRLPDVPSVYAPHGVGASPQANSAPIHTTSSPPRLGSLPPSGDPNVGPSGTLASPAGRSVTEPPPQVVLAGATAGTLPSENLPMLYPVSHGAPRLRRGVAPWAVIVLVLASLLAGFLLGFATARFR